jgi:hypothetical protein
MGVYEIQPVAPEEQDLFESIMGLGMLESVDNPFTYREQQKDGSLRILKLTICSPSQLDGSISG